MRKYVRIIAALLVLMMFFTGCGTPSSGKNTEAGNNSQSEMQSSQDEVLNSDENSQDSENDSQNSESVNETEITLYAQSAVNVRSLPSTDGEKLGTLSINQEIIGLGDAVDGWQKVRYNDGIAYVSAQYLGTQKVEVQASTQTQMQVDEITAADLPVPGNLDPDKPLIVIDAGHQGKGNSQKEPDGPGSSTLKAKVTSGATGCVTGQQEYVLNLKVALKLRDELEARGYQVVMIRETHSINISNSERAKYANSLNADAFIRIHANSSDNSSVTGAETLCQTSFNPYNAHLYSESRRLSECILDEFVESTGANKRRVVETDTMSGINWCQVPVSIIEMGFLSNAEEDRLMNSDDYQNKMVEGIANGLDKYFGR